MTEPRCRHGWLISANQCPDCKEIEKKDKEIAELKESYGHKLLEKEGEVFQKNMKILHLETQLSRLTAALKDDERAEKVVATKPHWNNSYNLGRIEGITDYRAEILKEAGGGQ